MKDGIIKGNGNSRYLKTVSDALTRWPTYEAFMQDFIAGQFLFDLNGINADGWTQQGTALNKANLLTDETARKVDLTDAATPNDMFSKVAEIANSAQMTADGKCKIKTGTYTGTGDSTKTISVGFEPLFMAIMINATSGSSILNLDVPYTTIYCGQATEATVSASSTTYRRNFSTTSTGITISSSPTSGTSTTVAATALNTKDRNYFWVAIA